MARAAVRNKAVRGIAVSAGAAAARHVGPIAQERYAHWRDRRVYRDRAVKLARQIGGRYSEETIIGGEPHFVVWKDGEPTRDWPSLFRDAAPDPPPEPFSA